MPCLHAQMKLGLKGKYKCGHNIILAHAKAVQLYRQKYKSTQNGKLSIALDGKWGYAKDPKNPEGEGVVSQSVSRGKCCGVFCLHSSNADTHVVGCVRFVMYMGCSRRFLC